MGSDARAAASSTGSAARAGALAGARDAAGTVAAIGQLRGALWEALAAAMAPLDAPTTAALAERLAFVCDAVGGRRARRHDFRVRDARGDWRAAIERHWRPAARSRWLAVEADDPRGW